MEHLPFPKETVGSKDLAIDSARLGDKRITETNKSSTYFDIRGHGDWYLPFGSQKIGNEMSVDL